MSLEIKAIKNKRQAELDIARGVAIFLMISQHLWLLIFSQFINNIYIDYTLYILGIVLGAPVFLFIMGVNIANSHHNDPRRLFIRGLKLIFLGYGLSALRFFIPIVLAQHFGLISNPENIIYHFKPIYYLLEIDILQLAGLSLMIIALLRWQQVKNKYYLALAFVIAFFAPFLWQINVSGFLKYLVDPFWGTDAYVLFPLFSCFFYPLIGVYFGNLLVTIKNKELFYKKCFINLIPVIVLGLIFVLVDFNISRISYYRHDVGVSLIFGSLIIYWLAFIYLNYHKWPVKIINTLTIWSKNVTQIYIVQWLLNAWAAVLISLK